MENLSDEAIIRVLSMDVRSINQENMNLLTFVPKHRTYQDFFRKKLTYCLECMKNGYHSIFTQFSLIHECPFHGNKLLDHCPKCNKSFSYRLNDVSFIEPFQCFCGYNFLNVINNYSYTWCKKKPQMISSEVINWISLYNNKKINKDNLILPSNLSVSSMPGAMDYIFQAIDNDYHSLRAEKHIVIKSGTKIMLQGNFHIEFQAVNNSMHDENHFKFIEKINEEIYQSSRSALYGIAKHLRTTIMRGHTHCVRKLGMFGKKCPYAFAYVNWRKFIEGHNHWWQVDNHYRPLRHHYNFEMDLISKQDFSEIRDIFIKWENDRPYWRYKHLTATKWIINKVLAHLALNHFYSWMEIAANSEFLESEYHSVPFKYENVPFFLIHLPNNEGEMGFHWWLSEHHQQLYNMQRHLECPFYRVLENDSAICYCAELCRKSMILTETYI